MQKRLLQPEHSTGNVKVEEVAWMEDTQRMMKFPTSVFGGLAVLRGAGRKLPRNPVAA